MSDKKGLVPIISEDACRVVHGELSAHSGDFSDDSLDHTYVENNYALGLARRLAFGDNPNVTNFLKELMAKLPKSHQPSAYYTGLIVYALIETQAEANRASRQ